MSSRTDPPDGKNSAGVLVIFRAGVYNRKNAIERGFDPMEESRSFGYLCPHCKKPVLAQRTRFALSAAAVRIECECEKSERPMGCAFACGCPAACAAKRTRPR